MKPPDGLKLALAQPQIREAETADGREADATGMIRNAGSSGADLVLFPESFPGPLRAGESRDAEPDISLAIRPGRFRLHAAPGDIPLPATIVDLLYLGDAVRRSVQ